MALSVSLPSTLRFRLSSLVVLLVLGATVTITAVALVLAERDMKEVIGGQQYALLSSAASHIDEHLASKKDALAELAEGLPAATLHNPQALHDYVLLSASACRRADEARTHTHTHTHTHAHTA